MSILGERAASLNGLVAILDTYKAHRPKLNVGTEVGKFSLASTFSKGNLRR
jgi:hypothetical protein